jgi:hypothetical protein
MTYPNKYEDKLLEAKLKVEKEYTFLLIRGNSMCIFRKLEDIFRGKKGKVPPFHIIN